MTTTSIRMRRLAAASASAALLAFAGSAAHAQQSQTAQASQPGGLEEVVVTARRVEERLQTTPIAVSAVSSEQLKALNITRLQGLDTVVPNLQISDAPSNGLGTIVFIRGIGAVSVSAYSDPPIGIYLDGVVQARPVGNASDLPDIERAEVLRGPQGTLFGRNTTGGLIALYTKKPTQDFGGSAEFAYGRYNEVNANVVLNTGELGKSGVKTKFTWQRHTYDGYAFTPGRKAGRAGGSYGAQAFSFALQKSFGDNLTVDNRLFYDKTEARPFYQVVTASGAAVTAFSPSQSRGGGPFIVDGSPLDIFYPDPRLANYDPFAKSWGDTLTVTYDASDALTVKSITGIRKLIQQQNGQLGGSSIVGAVGSLTNIVPVNFVTPNDQVSELQVSEELQASGKVGEFNYVAGLYYFDEELHEDLRTVTPAPAATGLVSLTDGRTLYSVPTTSYAAYGNLGWKPGALDDRLELVGGIRYTKDKKKENTFRIVNGAFQGPQNAANSWSNVGYTGSVNYQWTTDIMTYFRYSSAYRAGGYNPAQIGAPVYGPEKANTAELGFKTELFERRARINGALFKTWYDNQQINQRNAATAVSFVVNAGKAVYTGAEMETTLVLAPGFNLNAAVGYVDPHYKEYNFLDATGNTINLAGAAHFPAVSRWTYNFGGMFKTTPTGIGVVTLQMNYSFQSSRFSSPIDSLSPNNLANPSGKLTNLKGSLTISEWPWLEQNSTLKNVSFQIYGDNLANARYRLGFVDFGTYGTASFNRPRTYGARLRTEF